MCKRISKTRLTDSEVTSVVMTCSPDSVRSEIKLKILLSLVDSANELNNKIVTSV